LSEKLSAVGRASLFLVFTAMTVAILDAEAVAVELVSDGIAQDPRREDDRWEVDVMRPDGSMVQVSLGEDLELRGLDEELVPAGTLADDELRGPARELDRNYRVVEVDRESLGDE
jgi:hypothetical protein